MGNEHSGTRKSKDRKHTDPSAPPVGTYNYSYARRKRHMPMQGGGPTTLEPCLSLIFRLTFFCSLHFFCHFVGFH